MRISAGAPAPSAGRWPAAALLCLLAAAASPGWPAGSIDDPYRVPRFEQEVRVDGRLDETLWSEALRLELGYEVRPAENQPAPVRTEVLLASNREHLLVAFRCFDPEPERIRARYRDRDNAWADDFVGVVLDTFNAQRRAFELMANPLGVQIDAVNDEANGDYDPSWDAIWQSAGRITAQGYEVEFAIPFAQLRFQPGGGEQVWGFDAVRSYPRSNRHHIGLFPRERGHNSYLAQALKIRGFGDVDSGTNLQLVPTVVGTRVDQRGEDGELGSGDEEGDVGLTGRWVMTPNWTLSGAVNPDFSQVEADVLQLDVNQQFALFFPETRPFFLEGADTFGSDLNLVYTRTVVDPSLALKVNGKQGRHTVGVFAARDEITNVLLPGAQGSSSVSLAQESTSSALRYRYDLGTNSTIGVLFTDRRGEAGYGSSVGSFDLRYRPSASDTFQLQAAFSDTTYSATMVEQFGLDPDQRSPSGHAIGARYSHTRRTWGVNANYQDRDEEFRADLGFLARVDVRGFNADAYVQRIGEPGDWFNRLSTAAWIYRNEQQSGELLDEGWGINVEGGFARETELRFWWIDETRRFAARDFELNYFGFGLEGRPGRSLRWNLRGEIGDWIDFSAARPADRVSVRPSLRVALGRRFDTRFVLNYSSLDVDGGKLFTAQGPELRLIYYLNRRLFVRLIGQYTEIETNTDLAAFETAALDRSLLTQLLLAYEVSPQTALYVGYGDTFDNRLESQSPGSPGQLPEPPVPTGLERSSRAFFVKLGYAWSP